MSPRLVSCLRRASLPAALLLLLLALPLHAQPADWGEVPREHLAMTTYAPDSNATAVVLFDVGETDFRRLNGELELQRHVRVKILTEAGYDHATVEIPFYDGSSDNRVRKIEGATYVLADDGSVIEHELDDDEIFEEDLDGEYRVIKFTLPALEPGAVVEYRYAYRSKNIFALPRWNFQRDEPTLWSEYVLNVPRGLSFNTMYMGATDFHVQDRRERADETEARWVMKDVPALRAEPFMTALEDRRAGLRTRFRSYQNPRDRASRIDFMRTWEDMAESLDKHSRFGQQLDNYRAVRRKAREIVAGIGDDPRGKAEAIYDFVRTAMAHDGVTGRLLASRNLDDVLEARSGTNAELALLLTDMLQQVDVEAHPVLISTRDHGMTRPFQPMLAQFDDVIVRVALGDEVVLLDPTDPLRPFGMLPPAALNGQGWMAVKDAPRWVEVPSNDLYQQKLFVSATLDAAGTLTGTVTSTDESYSALAKRHDLDEAEDDADLLRELLLGDLAEVTLTETTVEGRRAIEEPLRLQAAFEAPAYAQAAGDYLYVSPHVVGRAAMLLGDEGRNPLRLPERSFPVDFGHPRVVSLTLALELPAGYTVAEQPENTRIRLPGNGAVFTRLTQTDGRRLSMRSMFVIRQTRFEPEVYGDLKRFFDVVVAAYAEPLVLTRTADAPATSASSSGEE
jgi:hypothetical protein